MKYYFFLIFLFLIYCRESPKEFETEVVINRMEKVMIDDKGEPLLVDVEINYTDCPGTQIEIIRGNKEFGDCIFANHKVGQRLKLKIEWKWNSLGFYKWEVKELNSCKRYIDPQDEVSYDMIEECEDHVVYGIKTGFDCKRIPTAKLIEKCPWFRRL
ncbi:MAG: hypothetical protein SFU98_15440 [Leptospiraceae bacterium]|nr:hypothetical protein [Leptospiraceae bacterium]